MLCRDVFHRDLSVHVSLKKLSDLRDFSPRFNLLLDQLVAVDRENVSNFSAIDCRLLNFLTCNANQWISQGIVGSENAFAPGMNLCWWVKNGIIVLIAYSSSLNFTSCVDVGKVIAIFRFKKLKPESNCNDSILFEKLSTKKAFYRSSPNSRWNARLHPKTCTFCSETFPSLSCFAQMYSRAAIAWMNWKLQTQLQAESLCHCCRLSFCSKTTVSQFVFKNRIYRGNSQFWRKFWNSFAEL